MTLRNLCLILAWTVVALTPTAHAAVLTLSPSLPVVQVGDTFSVDLQISDVGAGNAVGTYDLDVGFDGALVSLTGVSFGAGLDVLGMGSVQFATPGAGIVNLFELSLDLPDDLIALQPDSFVLATLNFTAAAAGTSNFTLFLNALGDAYGDELQASLVDGSVTVGAPASVPEPATYALVAAAMALAGTLTGRRSRM